MSAARSLALRGVKVARRATNRAGRLPRQGYAHCFIEGGGVHSRLHLHHFYSLFLPDVTDPVDVHVGIFNADGRKLGTVSRRLAPFSALVLPVADVLAEVGERAAFGTVSVDVEPAESYSRRLVEVGPEGAMAQSPFWMGYHDDGGSVAYVHSIDQFYGEIFGVGRLAGLAYRARWRRGGAWASKRLIATRDLRSADAYLVNHSPSAGRATVRWVAHPGGAVLAERTVTVRPHGAMRASVVADDIARAPSAVEWLRLEVDELLTGNGKPYVMVRYGDGPFSLHHG